MTSYELVEGVHYTRDGSKVTLIKFPEMPEHERVAIYDGNEHVCGTCPVNIYGERVGWDHAHPHGALREEAIRFLLSVGEDLEGAEERNV